ncbi:nucleoside monophosphate kinase [Kamptonema cortianum]|nr:nucleoside monophosphate kinase [Oscillatoria laete-virens]MDK3160223.1 nucleoside monophosphate kinase [Kamptonema cortianum]MDL5048422.1 nucleoside monophosphate kinase [Oscillatoria amoena NRMC-F 0135]MDL5055666.1 nucleoside monophosphate kinase [Oscillatoria laete-virens NRMC-F 0139]
MKYKTFLLFGSPGSGKGTQGMVLGRVPGYFHCSCGDVFRSVDLGSEMGKAFMEYSSRGELVPDDLTIKLWQNSIKGKELTRNFKVEADFLILDGIPRNLPQAQYLEAELDVLLVFHLVCPDRKKLVERLKKRAIKDNRHDDANEEVIRNRLQVYEDESKPVLDFYGRDKVININAEQRPDQVLHDILHYTTKLTPH